MAREIDFDSFCKRMYAQGQSAYLFGIIHDTEEVSRYCELKDMRERWQKVEPFFHERIQAARRLDKYASLRQDSGLGLDANTKQLLHDAYLWAFKACKLKGMNDAHRAGAEVHKTSSD